MVLLPYSLFPQDCRKLEITHYFSFFIFNSSYFSLYMAYTTGMEYNFITSSILYHLILLHIKSCAVVQQCYPLYYTNNSPAFQPPEEVTATQPRPLVSSLFYFAKLRSIQLPSGVFSPQAKAS